MVGRTAIAGRRDTEALSPTRTGVRRRLGPGYRAETPGTEWKRRLELPFSFVVAA